MSWLTEHFAAVLSAAVAVAGLWALWGQRNATKALEEATTDLEEATTGLEEATTDLRAANKEQRNELAKITVSTRKGFLEVQWLIRRSVALLCVVAAALAFALALS